MNADPEMPSLSFFRATPPDLLKYPPLASSLQTFETCLLLIGIGRYPSALVSCATAWESVIKAKLAIESEDRITSERLLKEIRSRFVALRAFDESKLSAFRRTRNRLVHFGFSPKDDEECALLLLETGFPFLSLLYIELFDFFLDWREIRPGTTSFLSLSSEEMAKAGLLPEVAQQLSYAREVYGRARHLAQPEYVYCFSGLSHYIRLCLKESARTTVEWNIVDTAESIGTKFEHEQKLRADLNKVLGDLIWDFDCPICQGIETVVAELDDKKLNDGEVVTKRCACVQCGFVVGRGAAHLSEVLLAAEIAEKKPKILTEFGINA